MINIDILMNSKYYIEGFRYFSGTLYLTLNSIIKDENNYNLIHKFGNLCLLN